MRKRSMIMILVFALITFVTVIVTTVGLKTHDGYKISVPYNGYGKTSYYTYKYTEKDGCIMFTDDWGKKRKICGIYEIEGY
jgi:hypothetical protein